MSKPSERAIKAVRSLSKLWSLGLQPGTQIEETAARRVDEAMGLPSLDRMLDLHYRLDDFLDDQADTRDGADGRPKPNTALSLLGDVRELIADLEDASGDDRPVTTGGTGGASSVARDGRSSAETFGGGDDAAPALEPVSMEGAATKPGADAASSAPTNPACVCGHGQNAHTCWGECHVDRYQDDAPWCACKAFVAAVKPGAPVSLLVLTPSDLRPGDVIVYGSGNVFEIGATRPWGSDGSYIVFPARAGGGWVAHGHERLSVRRMS